MTKLLSESIRELWDWPQGYKAQKEIFHMQEQMLFANAFFVDN
jgi:hypothetical protein